MFSTIRIPTTVAVQGANMCPTRPINDAIPIAWLLWHKTYRRKLCCRLYTFMTWYNVTQKMINSFLITQYRKLKKSIKTSELCKRLLLLSVFSVWTRNNDLQSPYHELLSRYHELFLYAKKIKVSRGNEVVTRDNETVSLPRVIFSRMSSCGQTNKPLFTEKGNSRKIDIALYALV